MSKIKLNTPGFFILTGLITIGIITSLVLSMIIGFSLKEKKEIAQEKASPAELALTIIEADDCQDCFSLDGLINTLLSQPIKITEKNTLTDADPSANDLLDKYSIDKLPALIIQGEIHKNKTLDSLWQKLGETVDDTFILRQIGYPYKEISSGKVRGEIEITLLEDQSCDECYDARGHLTALSSFGFTTDKAMTLDKQDTKGQALIDKYQIDKLPTIVITGDLSVSPGFNEIWPEYGSQETDGTFIFRQGLDKLGVTYKDLALDQVVKPNPVVSTN